MNLPPTPPAPLKYSKAVINFVNSADPYNEAGVEPMRWDKFLEVMRKLRFEEESTESASAVRFIPPEYFENNEPITFHKPYPDPTLPPIMVTAFARRLKKHYRDDFTLAHA
ncbi:hypothetical protein FPV67DRAFT_1036054 [Lyophyllum atratum]|nr:hypothetical protein FPV67DRAFT_1036054 [Lyophyllum atratum]